MEKPEKITINKNNFIQVEVLAYLITPECDEFENVKDKEIKFMAEMNTDIVIPAFKVKIKFKNKKLTEDMEKMIQSEINENISSSRKIAKIVSSITQKNVEMANPTGSPKTESIKIADYIITPDGKGMIGYCKFNELNKIAQ